MATWTDNGARLDLGELGEVLVLEGYQQQWQWRWKHDGSGFVYPTAARARSAAESWLRRALKQAGKRLEVKRG